MSADAPPLPSEPPRRPVPWVVIVPALLVAVGGTFLIRDIIKPARGTVTTSSARAPILGLDDEATKRLEAELYAPASAATSASSAQLSAAPATSATTATSATSAAPSVAPP